MRAPRFVHEFLEWRWATCAALIAAALAFVVLTLLLIPTQLGETHLDVATRAIATAPTAPENAARAVSPSGDSAPLNRNAASAPRSGAAPDSRTTENEVIVEPNGPPLVVGSAPDFARNIADRADRPTRPKLGRADGQ